MSPKPGHLDASEAIDAFRSAATHNLEDPLRDGMIIRLPGYGQAVMTGDLHGHRRNLAKLQKYAMLDRVAARHVILHEIAHAELMPSQAVDHSHEAMLTAAKYKCDCPEPVHFLQSNHELSQLTGYPIAKNGRAVVEEFNHAVEMAYGQDRAAEVLAAIDEFIASFPLAATTEGRVWMSHSLPNTYDMDGFDLEVFKQTLTRETLQDNKTVFNLVWGRRHSQEHIDRLAELLDADVFIIGHQPQETGWKQAGKNLIILASDHNHGCLIDIDLAQYYTIEKLIEKIVPLASIP